MAIIKSKNELTNKYLDNVVRIISTHKTTYRRQNVINKYGVVENVVESNIGVKFNDIINGASSTGLYWFKECEIQLASINNREEDIMTGYKYVATVNLLEDYSKKDYNFALYDSEFSKIEKAEQLVIVNPRNKDSRVLGKIKEIIPIESYRGTVTAQVVAVVDTSAYDERIAEEERQKEIAIKKAAIEKELEEEINKRKTLEFYEKMAQEYSDNPRLAELVKELKGLEA